MIVIEAKLRGTQSQYSKLDEAIRTGQFIRNTCLQHWEDKKGVTRNDLQKLCSVLAKNKETPWTKKLNSQARQAHADRAWSAIQRFYENCRLGKSGKKGYPKYKKFSRSVEYKNSGWKLSADRRQITFTDGFEVGTMNLWSSRDLVWYSEKQISRVRVIRRADGYYAQFLVDWDRREEHEFQGKMTGIDLGLKEFYTDSEGNTVDNPRYLRKSERRLKMLQRRVSKKHLKGKKQSNRYHKARKALAKQHLKVSRQREDKARKDALALVKSNDLIVYEDLKIRNMVKNHHLAKSISDASWYQFIQWLQYFAKVHGVIVIAVPPHNTTVDCSCCGAKVKKMLSTRTHRCSKCGTVLDRDHNAAKNILVKGFKLLAEYLNSTVGHTESGAKSSKAQGETDLWLKNGNALALSRLDELRTKNSWESPAILLRNIAVGAYQSVILPSGQYRPFLWENGVMTDLNNLIPADSGFTLFDAQGINDSGQIVGAGVINGESHAVLLSPIEQPEPVPEPTSTLGLLAFGALGTGSILKRKLQKAPQLGIVDSETTD